MRGRLGLGLLISFAIHFLFFQRVELFQFPTITLATYPVSMELSLTAPKPSLKEFKVKEILPEVLPKVEELPKPKEATPPPEKKIPVKAVEKPSVKAASMPAPKERGIRQATPLPGQKPPVYPMVARYRQLEGRVLLLVEVLANGQCGQIKIKESSGVAILDEAAIQGVQKWRFEPALKNGEKVKSFLEVPVVFELKSN